MRALTRARRQPTPLEAIAGGLLAGAAGTAVLTGVQMAVYKLTGGGTSAAPGEVGKRVVEGVLQQPVAEEHMPQIAQGVHGGTGAHGAPSTTWPKRSPSPPRSTSPPRTTCPSWAGWRHRPGTSPAPEPPQERTGQHLLQPDRERRASAAMPVREVRAPVPISHWPWRA